MRRLVLEFRSRWSTSDSKTYFCLMELVELEEIRLTEMERKDFVVVLFFVFN